MKFTLISSFVALLSVVVAAPLDLYKRDVFVPPVLTPNAESVWKVGSIQNVTWDVSHPPKQITNTKASIILVKERRLDFDHPLATDLDVLAGHALVTVPNVAPGNKYQIIVFGDSGNTGECFTITE